MAVRQYIKGLGGQDIFIGDYLTQRRKLDEARLEMKVTTFGSRLYEYADYQLELENDANKAAQRLGLIHDQYCDGCPIRCKYCAINHPGQHPWR